jgi:hypothetical protein
VATGFSEANGIAVDGSGNVYVADNGMGSGTDVGVYKETLSNGVYSQTNLVSSVAFAVAVDGAGNVYYMGDGGTAAYKLTLSNGSYTQSTVATGFSEANGIAVDGSGNVYVADNGMGPGTDVGVYKETLSNGVYSQTNLVSSVAFAVAVDGAGNVYYMGDGGTAAYKLDFAVSKATTTTQLGSSPNPAIAGQKVTLSAAVAETSGSGVPTGTVTFYDGATSLGSGALSSGRATFSTSSLAVGSHSVTASYGGDASNLSSTSAAVSVTITPATPAALTTPTPGSTLGTSNVVFTWTAGTGVTEYNLWLGTSAPGSSGLYVSGWLTTTSATVTSLPAKGAKVYARLYSMVEGVEHYNDYTYTEAGTPAAMSTPASGSTLGTTDVKFTWTAGYGVTEYNLWMGTSGAGSSNLYNSGWVTTTSATLTSVPAKGAKVYARLYSMVEGVEHYNDYTYSEATAGTPATMISPTSGSKLGTSGVMFTWTAGTGATQYNLWLGTSGPGSSSLFASGWTASMSATVLSLPAKGATVYARLYSDVNGVTQYNDYTYTEQ